MEINACGHVALPSPIRMCPNLVGTEDKPFVALLTGVGVEYDVCCGECDPPAELQTVCEGCVERVTIGLFELTAWRGEPEIRRRPEPVDTAVRRTPLGLSPIDFAPLPDGRWLLLLDSPYRLVPFDPTDGSKGQAIDVPLAAEEATKSSWGTVGAALHVSPDGRFAVVAHDHGNTGAAVDLETGEVTVEFHRHKYHNNTTRYPIAFAALDGRQVLCHATSWSEVAWVDPATGEPHGTTQPSEQIFHGRLAVSPTGRWIAADGWVWSPVGRPAVWDLRDLSDTKLLCQRWYYWGKGMCWVGDDLLALSGIGPDDEIMLDGVRVFDAVSGNEVTAFAGPRGTFFADDRRLYSVTEEGVEIWDPATGDHTGSVPGFVPTRQRDGELAAVVDGVLITWKTISKS
ncbi:hypothetical protein [Umezawaea sp. NPDC059074]|uniref:hypothetical protein n=1 Tax=Umezawaea sp. NPDC059074 TaxID=3346716 RepID=UPI00368EB71B